MEQPPGWTASPENRLKNWLFCRAACGNFPRMAAKLRPVGRQTTSPEHAGELPAYSLAEQRNFFTGFREKQSSQEAVPSAAEARGTGTLLRSIWTEAPERLRKNAWALEGAFSLHICAPNVPDLRPCVFYTIISADIFYLQRTILNQEIYEQENALALQVYAVRSKR